MMPPTVSTPGRTRTCDPGIRNPMLYPAELPGRAELNFTVYFKRGTLRVLREERGRDE